MSRTKTAQLICFDDHRTITEDMRKRFSDPAKYKVESFHNRQNFISTLKKLADSKSCKVAVIVVSDGSDQIAETGKMTDEISKINPDTGIILIVPSGKMEEVKKSIKYNIDAYITRNTNAILRIHNEVKKLVSEYNINIYRMRRNLSLYILCAFLIITVLILVIAFLRLPMYF